MAEHDRGSRIFGFLLQAMGVLIMAASGLCAGAVLFALLFGKLKGNPQKDIPFVLLVSGVPLGVGWAMFQAGGRMRR